MILNLSLDFNPDTKKFKVLSVTTEDQESVIDSNEPQLVLEDSKYVINQAAATLLGVGPDSRISIGYQPVGDTEVPVIGAEDKLGCGNGNRLGKSLSVIYKGKQNERLSRFGKVFSFTQFKDGIFILEGDKPIDEPYSTDPEISDIITISEDMTSHEDISQNDEPLTFDDDFEFEETTDKNISVDALSFE